MSLGRIKPKDMKAITLLAGLSAMIILNSCSDTCETTYTMSYYTPVYTSLEELRSSTDVEDPREVLQSGKIYYINDHLLINEPNEGIHIINNVDPSNPRNVAFIKIPGNFDMAANGNYLYADSYIDLVVFDISNIENPVEVERMENIFPGYNSYGYYLDPELGLVTDWELTEEFVEINNNCGEEVSHMMYAEGMLLQTDASFSASSAVSPANPGVGGSMARFTINKQHLYMIDQSKMYYVDITNPSSPKYKGEISIRWGIETIFPYDSLIFIGAMDGMSIYDVSEPSLPEHLSTFSHVTSCDPVVTDGRYAYVTLRSGTECQGFTNQLEIIDIADPRNPVLIKTYEMSNPHGLSINDNKLYICDGDAGLKIYNAHNVENIDDNMIRHYDNIHAYDVIVIDSLVMLIGDDGLYQYTCDEFNDDIQYLSVIPFSKNE